MVIEKLFLTSNDAVTASRFGTTHIQISYAVGYKLL